MGGIRLFQCLLSCLAIGGLVRCVVKVVGWAAGFTYQGGLSRKGRDLASTPHFSTVKGTRVWASLRPNQGPKLSVIGICPDLSQVPSILSPTWTPGSADPGEENRGRHLWVTNTGGEPAKAFSGPRSKNAWPSPAAKAFWDADFAIET